MPARDIWKRLDDFNHGTVPRLIWLFARMTSRSLPEEMTYDLAGVEVAEDEVIGIHKKRTLLAITTRRVIKWVWTQNRDQPDAGRSKEL